jgi:hypothetical protein
VKTQRFWNSEDFYLAFQADNSILAILSGGAAGGDGGFHLTDASIAFTT